MSCSIHYRIVSPNANRIPGQQTEWDRIAEIFGTQYLREEVILGQGALPTLKAMAIVSDCETWPALIEAIETHGSIRLYLEC